MTASIELFFRDGRKFAGTPLKNDKGFYALIRRACGRCGGAGRSDRWAYTGYTCYDCGGSGNHKNGPAEARLFTAEKLEKLNASQAKRDATKAAKKAEEARKDAERAERERDAFNAVHGALIARARPFIDSSDFLRSIVVQADTRALLTDSQVEALTKAVERAEALAVRKATEAERKAASKHVGTVGGKVELVVSVVRSVLIQGASRFDPDFHILSLVDQDGNSIVCKGSLSAGAFDMWKRKGGKYRIGAKVKAHESYTDKEGVTELQTRIFYVKMLEVIEEGEKEKSEAY